MTAAPNGHDPEGIPAREGADARLGEWSSRPRFASRHHVDLQIRMFQLRFDITLRSNPYTSPSAQHIADTAKEDVERSTVFTRMAGLRYGMAIQRE